MSFLSLKPKRFFSLLLLGVACHCAPVKTFACPYKNACLLLAGLTVATYPYWNPVWNGLEPETKTDVKIVLGSAAFASVWTGAAYLIHAYNVRRLAENACEEESLDPDS